jgi:MFS family permease
MVESSTPIAQPSSTAVAELLQLNLAPPPVAKAAIRTSLEASTIDGIFAAIFSNITGGVLLSNFLVELHASPVEIGMIASIPMVANLIQPLGAELGDRTNSRHNYCFAIYAPSRLIWLLLVLAIGLTYWHTLNLHQLVPLTLLTLLVTHFLGALGSAAWLSWLAALVPRRLRGRYFGIRNSAANFTSLLAIPAAGWFVSAYPAGTLGGYAVVLLLGVISGMISLAYQWKMIDVNPQTARNKENSERSAGGALEPGELAVGELSVTDARLPRYALPVFLQDPNFLRFLLYLSVWMFAVNLSAPFFNLYMLDNLAIDISWVTVYNSLTAGANLLLMVSWGKLADRFGNRALLLSVGVLVALTPLLWLGTSADTLSLWLWLPLLHILAGGTWAAIDLCSNNIQLDIAPVANQSKYFAVAAAIAGVSGAIGTTVGGFLAEMVDYGGLPGLFALSSVVRLAALLPLVFVRETRAHSVRQMLKSVLPFKHLRSLNQG